MPGFSGNHADPLALPPCPLSKYYLSYLDLLDSPYFLRHEAHPMTQEHDVSMVERLQTHLITCSTCTAMVQQLRRMRSQQRAILHDVLLENEQYVLSSVSTIMEIVRREQPVFSGSNHTRMNGTFSTDSSSVTTGSLGREARQAVPFSSRPVRLSVTLRALFSMVVVIVLIISAALISNQLITLRSPSPLSSHSAALPRFTYIPDWGSVVMSQVLHGRTSITNYNPYNGHHTPLVMPFAANNVKVDGVSHDGHNVLYQYSSSNHTYYATLNPLPQQGYFYALEDNDAGEAIWMSDNRHVLIAEQHEGIVEVDSQTGTAQTIAQIGHVHHLWFYRDNYLYFDYATKTTAQSSDLWRVNISTGTPERVIKTTNGRSYFLSPDGTTIFYIDTTSASQAIKTAIFTINVHALGRSSRVLLQIAAIPVGFALDNTLELIQEVHNTFQLVKLRPMQPVIDRVVMDDIAPNAVALCDHVDLGSIPICDENIALAPYSSGMIVIGLNKDGSRQIWTDDLITGKRLPLFTLSGTDTTHVQLPGWDRIQVI